MKNFFCLLVSLHFFSSVCAQATITGTLYHAPQQKIYLVNLYGQKVDSAITTSKNQSFTLTIKDIADETYFKIFYQKKGPGMLNQFVIMPGEHVVFSYDVSDADKNWWIDVTGSPRTAERIDVFRRIMSVKRNVEKYKHQIDSIRNLSPRDTGAIVLKQRLADAEEEKANSIALQLFDTTKSAINAGQMLSLLRSSYLLSERQKDSLIHVLQLRFPNDKNIRALTNNTYNADEQGPALDTQAPPIALKDINGQEVDLSQIKSKYILIDFWASWCNPCREESPNLLKAYAYYKNKGFRILSVSIDSDVQLWRNAVRKDGTTEFLQVIDPKAGKSVLLKNYKIIALPANFLVDRNGKIVAKDLRGNELFATLKKLLGN